MRYLIYVPLIMMTFFFYNCDPEESDEINKDNSMDTIVLRLTEHTRQDQMGDFAENAMVEFNGNVWSVGGYNGYSGGNSSSDVWRSANGINWESVTSNQFAARSNHTLTVYNNKMWLIGGVNESFSYLNDVWSSSDGENWNLETNSPPYLDAAFHEVEVFKNKLFLLKDGPGANVSVWSSSNGRSWTQETITAFPSRIDFETVVFNDSLFVLGGYDMSTRFNEIWKSADGITWTQVSTPTIFTPRDSHTATVYKGRVWVAGGIDTVPEGNLWYSSDMRNWFEYESFSSPEGLFDHCALNYDGEIYLFGGREGSAESGWNLTGKIRSILQTAP